MRTLSIICCILPVSSLKLNRKDVLGSQDSWESKACDDPKVTNLGGKKFEILALGNFNFLSVTDASNNDLYTLHATVDRAGDRCGATYIKNLTLAGAWIQESTGSETVELRPSKVVGIPSDGPSGFKELSLRFGEKEWQSVKEMRGGIVSKVSEDGTGVVLKFRDLTIQVQVDAHRIWQDGKKTRDYAEFLNVNFDGIQKVEKAGLNVAGLLARDDTTLAETAPEGCLSQKKNAKNIAFANLEPQHGKATQFISKAYGFGDCKLTETEKIKNDMIKTINQNQDMMIENDDMNVRIWLCYQNPGLCQKQIINQNRNDQNQNMIKNNVGT